MGRPTNEETQELLWEYGRRFNDSFPTMALSDTSNENICSEIKKCLERGEPYELDMTEGICY